MKYSAVRTLLVICSFFTTLTLSAQPTQLVAERLAYVDDVIQVLSFTNDPNEDRLFIMCHDGKIWVYEDGMVLEEPFFDIGADGLDIVDFGIGAEEGLNGMALDPNYAENGYFYLVYNGYLPDGSGETLYDEHVVRFQRSTENEYQADPTYWSHLLTFEMPRRGHNGGAIFFGEDGYLYVSCGDGGSTGTGASGGGSGGDEDNNGQSLSTILGKILRIDVSNGDPYTIPNDNPFVGVDGAREEIWAYGFRNPWRWSFDKVTGDMYIGDVGEVDWEEISYAPAGSSGLNFGWRLLEGSHCYEPVENCDPDNETVLPIWDYAHSENVCSVIGGFVYRGFQIPSLYGHYIYSDACGFADEKFWLLWNDGLGWQHEPVEVIVEGGFVPWTETRFGFGEDNQGELYICTRIAVYKIASDPNDDANGSKDVPLMFVPNPTTNSTVMDLGGNFALERIEVYNAQGKRVDELVASGAGLRYYTINTSAYSAGIYTVKVWCLGYEEIRTGKFMVAGIE